MEDCVKRFSLDSSNESSIHRIHTTKGAIHFAEVLSSMFGKALKRDMRKLGSE